MLQYDFCVDLRVFRIKNYKSDACIFWQQCVIFRVCQYQYYATIEQVNKFKYFIVNKSL